MPPSQGVAAAKLDEGGRPARRAPLLYAFPIFLGAFLLFQVQLLIGKYILPWFGGTAAVWTTCLLAFQLLLLAGYGYAHWLKHRPGRQQAAIHLFLLLVSLLFLAVASTVWPAPITPGGSWKPANLDHPIAQILALLLSSVALPYLVLSTTGPLLQQWFGEAHRGSSPYRLYALSNLGSLLGLLSYPFLVEPSLTVRSQAWLWSALYLAFAILVGVCAFASRFPNPKAGHIEPATQTLPGPLLCCGSWRLGRPAMMRSSGMRPLWLWLQPLRRRLTA